MNRGKLALVVAIGAALAVAAARFVGPLAEAPVSNEHEAYIVLSLTDLGPKQYGGRSYVEITQEDLDAKPLLAAVLSAFYDPEGDSNARKVGDTLYYGTIEAAAVDLKDYIEGRGASVIKYREDYFQLGVLLT